MPTHACTHTQIHIHMYIYRDNRIMYSNINIAMPFDICYGDGHKTMPTAVQRSSCNGKWNEKERERTGEKEGNCKSRKRKRGWAWAMTGGGWVKTSVAGQTE